MNDTEWLLTAIAIGLFIAMIILLYLEDKFQKELQLISRK